MNDDFNTPIAVSVLFELAAEVNRSRSAADAALLKGLGATLGVLQQLPRAFLQAGAGLDEASIAALIEERRAAKSRGDYARSDAIRTQLAAQGVVLKDSAQGTTWVRG
jgi:cysteinyl-tRNA synthetase